jgi:hypothetical protein
MQRSSNKGIPPQLLNNGKENLRLMARERKEEH